MTNDIDIKFIIENAEPGSTIRIPPGVYRGVGIRVPAGVTLKPVESGVTFKPDESDE